jgi:hypothetical protein
MVADWPMTTRRMHSQLGVYLMLHLTLSKIHFEEVAQLFLFFPSRFFSIFEAPLLVVVPVVQQ